MIDLLFVIANNASGIYQNLSKTISAIEPPTWALILAESARSAGSKAAILDCAAEGLSDKTAVQRIQRLQPRLIIFVVYGQNVNAGTANMSGATRTARAIKSSCEWSLIGFIGSHVQALPEETLLKEKAIDFVFLNEGVHSLIDIIKSNCFKIEKLRDVSGLALRIGGEIIFSGAPKLVSQENLPSLMPGYAWDLLPFNERPLDLYRSPLWHADYQEQFRSPYAAIQTSIGCNFKCNFCMINLINRDDNEELGVASRYSGMRFWPASFVREQIQKLMEMGVRTIRITDEMFLLNKKYYLPICDELIALNKSDSLRLWAYSRIDTVPSQEILKQLRKAGFRWLCLGIESGDKKIRLESAKGKFEEVDVRDVIKRIELCGINVIANYIYGLPGDTPDTIEKTFALSLELKTAGWNTYAAMALPGSGLYKDAKEAGIPLPDSYEGYSFHSYETLPLPTQTMSAAEVLRMRDDKFHEYFENAEILKMIENKFGSVAKENVMSMTRTRLKRRILE